MDENRTCVEMRHRKGTFSVHLCIENKSIVEGRVYVNLWTEYDENLCPRIAIPDDNPYYNIPKRILEDYDLMEALRQDLSTVSNGDPMPALVKHGIA